MSRTKCLNLVSIWDLFDICWEQIETCLRPGFIVCMYVCMYKIRIYSLNVQDWIRSFIILGITYIDSNHYFRVDSPKFGSGINCKWVSPNLTRKRNGFPLHCITRVCMFYACIFVCNYVECVYLMCVTPSSGADPGLKKRGGGGAQHTFAQVPKKLISGGGGGGTPTLFSERHQRRKSRKGGGGESDTFRSSDTFMFFFFFFRFQKGGGGTGRVCPPPPPPPT